MFDKALVWYLVLVQQYDGNIPNDATCRQYSRVPKETKIAQQNTLDMTNCWIKFLEPLPMFAYFLWQRYIMTHGYGYA